MPGLSSWSLRRRLAGASLALAVVLVAVVAVSAALLIAVRSQQSKVVNRYFAAVTLANGRFVDQIDAETAVRGYALTQDRSTLQPLQNVQSTNYRIDAQQMSALIQGDQATVAGFRAWESASQTWVSQWALPTIDRVQADPTTNLSSADVLEGKRLFDGIRQAYGDFSAQLVDQRQSANHRLTTLTTLLFVGVALVVASVLLAALALWFALRRWVLNPLDDLAAETRVVRGGDLSHVVEVHGPKELASLATDVDEMRGELVEQLQQVETARVELEAAGAAITERAAELSRSNRDLEQFAYVASHDLQEPLRKVASFCQLLEQRYKGQLDERADEYIAFAVDGAKRMQQLINDLLAFSRVGRSGEEFVEVDLGRCLDNALGNLSEAITESRAEVWREDLPVVPGDEVLLTQLFQNLISNSLKFRSSEPLRIEITASRRGGLWELVCADNGIGIDPQYADRIFVIFQRLHGKDEYAGTGIGLSLCKRIVEHHGGTIWLDQQVSQGTAFRWTLPAAARPRTYPLPPLQLEST